MQKKKRSEEKMLLSEKHFFFWIIPPQGGGKILSLVQTFQDLSYITPFGKTKKNMDINNTFDFLHYHFVIFVFFLKGFVF